MSSTRSVGRGVCWSSIARRLRRRVKTRGRGRGLRRRRRKRPKLLRSGRRAIADEGEGEEGDGTGWEYKPWNRDTDLEAGRTSTKALNPEDMMKKAGGDLKGRFGSAGDSRSFL
jgi:hypothetical protein